MYLVIFLLLNCCFWIIFISSFKKFYTFYYSVLEDTGITELFLQKVTKNSVKRFRLPCNVFEKLYWSFLFKDPQVFRKTKTNIFCKRREGT